MFSITEKTACTSPKGVVTLSTSELHRRFSSFDMPSVCFKTAPTPDKHKCLNKLSRVVVKVENTGMLLSKQFG